MNATHKLMVAGEKYTKDGEEKTRWIQMGVMLQGDGGKVSLKIDAIPTNFDGWVSVFPIEQKS